MNYGPCKACPSAVAAWSLSDAAVNCVPESVHLCLDHLKLLLKRRAEAAARAEREAGRRFCECGNEIYLRPETRTQCRSCEVPGTACIPRPAGTAINIKISDDWFTVSHCDEPECASKMVWHYPATGRTVCAKHGASPEPEGAHA